MATETTGSKNSELIRSHTLDTIAVLNVGDTHYLFREDEQGLSLLQHVDPERDRLGYMQATRALNSAHFHTFEGVHAPRVSMYDLGFSPPTVEWHERTGLADEPTFRFSATKATSREAATFDLYEQEIQDLFLKGTDDPTKMASFFTADTKSHELIGIAVKRQFPLLAFLRPGKDGGQFSSKMGLVTFLDNMYAGYSQNLSPLQWEVDQRVFDEFGPDGRLQFDTKAQSAAQQRQQSILKRIYQIKALILAGQAENKGAGLQDEALIAHAPFLATNGKPQNGGLFGRIFSTSQPEPNTTVSPRSWTDLAAKPHRGLISVEGQEAQYMPWSASQSNTNPQSSILGGPPQSRYSYVRKPVQPPAAPAPTQHQETAKPQRMERTSRQLTEKQKAMLEIRDLSHGLQLATRIYGDDSADIIDFGHVIRMNEAVANLEDMAREYSRSNRRGKPPIKPVQTLIEPREHSIAVGGIKDQYALNFLTGQQVVPWQGKIDRAFSEWQQNTQMLFQLAEDRFNRSVRALQRPGIIRRVHPDIAERLVQELSRSMRDVPRGVNIQNVDAACVSHLLLSVQVMYSLSEHYQNLKSQGDVIEIHNWASQVLSTLSRLRQLPVQEPNS